MKEKEQGRVKKNKMAVMTAECDRMFCVDKEQIQLFRKNKANPKNREKADVVVSKISKKITTECRPTFDDHA